MPFFQDDSARTAHVKGSPTAPTEIERTKECNRYAYYNKIESWIAQRSEAKEKRNSCANFDSIP